MRVHLLEGCVDNADKVADRVKVCGPFGESHTLSTSLATAVSRRVHMRQSPLCRRDTGQPGSGRLSTSRAPQDALTRPTLGQQVHQSRSRSHGRGQLGWQPDNPYLRQRSEVRWAMLSIILCANCSYVLSPQVPTPRITPDQYGPRQSSPNSATASTSASMMPYPHQFAPGPNSPFLNGQNMPMMPMNNSMQFPGAGELSR